MKVTVTPSDNSTALVEVEVPAQRVHAAVDEAVRHQQNRVRIPGFRPGKVPRQMLERALGINRADPSVPDPIYDDAREHLYQRSIVDAVRQEGSLDVLEMPAQPEWLSFSELSGASYKVVLAVRPSVELGDYEDYPFQPVIEPVTEDKVDQVIEQLREQQASLVPVEDRPAQAGDYVVIGFSGTREGELVEGAQAERFPLVLGNERMIPGFEDNIIGMAEGEDKTFTVTFPEEYPQSPDLAGQPVEFAVTLRELRERRLPVADDAFAASLGNFPDLGALRADIHKRLGRNALDRARHVFADQVIEYAAANATVGESELLIGREVDVMVDELKVRLAEQQIGYPEYLEATEKDEAALREEYREGAVKRVKVLLVLGAIADKENVVVPREAIDLEIARGKAANQENQRLVEYLDSPRGRAYVHSTLRRSQTVEMLVDRWIAAHPEFVNVKHTEDQVDEDDEVLGLVDDGEEPDAIDAEIAEIAAGMAGEEDR
ncbi:MAG: trigger factor [Chloroflexota bacterium]